MQWQWLIACFLFLTGILTYFPVIFIRKTDRLLKVLEQIEANTVVSIVSKVDGQNELAGELPPA